AAVVLVLVGPEKNSAKRRAQGERNKARDQRRRGDSHRELPEKQTGNSRDERRWYKNRAQSQRDRGQRTANLIHGDTRGLDRRHTAFKFAFDILDNDDSAVDHDANRQHQAEKRQIVDRNAQREENRECAEERYRNRDHRDDGGAPALQKKEDHTDDEENRDKD